MKPVTIYTTAWCPYCHRAKALLNAKSVPFEEIGAFGLWPETERVIALSRAQRNPNG